MAYTWSYKQSKEFGDIFEKKMLERIQINYPSAFIDDVGKANTDWDIYIPEIKEGVEVKTEFMHKFTKNLVVEVEMNDKPSALSVTKAKYWVIIDGYRIIWVKPIYLYRFIELNGHKRAKPWASAGDRKKKEKYLLIYDDFIKYLFTKVEKPEGWFEYISNDKYSDFQYKIIFNKYLKYQDNYMKHSDTITYKELLDDNIEFIYL